MGTERLGLTSRVHRGAAEKVSRVTGFFSGSGRYTECEEPERGDEARLSRAQDELAESIAANVRAKLQEEVKREKCVGKNHWFESTGTNGLSDFNVHRSGVDDATHSSVVDGTHKVERRRHRKHANDIGWSDPAFPPDGFNGFGPVADGFSGFGDFAPFEPWDKGTNTWPTVPATSPVDLTTDTKVARDDSNLSSGMLSTAPQGWPELFGPEMPSVDG